MGLYNVVAPCVVGNLHYARPTTAPIEVNEDVAEPLVANGSLEPYRPAGDVAPPTLGFDESLPWIGADDPVDDEPPTNPPPPRARGSRRKGGE